MHAMAMLLHILMVHGMRMVYVATTAVMLVVFLFIVLHLSNIFLLASVVLSVEHVVTDSPLFLL
jgi:hypothetical protein